MLVALVVALALAGAPTASAVPTMAVDCNAAVGGVQDGSADSCKYDVGQPFGVQVHVTKAPDGGYIGFQTKLNWTAPNLGYDPTPDGADEIVWDLRGPLSVRSPFDGSSGSPPLLHGSVSGVFPPFPVSFQQGAAIVDLNFICGATESLSPITLIPFDSSEQPDGTGPDGSGFIDPIAPPEDMVTTPRSDATVKCSDGPPQTSIDSGPSGTITTTSATFAFSSEPNATFECEIDAGGFTPCSSSKTYSGLSQGPHTFKVRATDAVGNTDQSPASRSFIVDTGNPPPQTTITSGPSGTITTTSATFAFSSEPNATFECEIDAGGFTPCSSPKTYPGLSQGPHTFTVRAIGTDNNVGPPVSRSFTVDTGESAAPPIFAATWGTYGSGDGQFRSPSGVATDLDGNVYVADRVNHRIQKFDSNGDFITEWGGYGSGNGQFRSPFGIATDPDGGVYVTERDDDRIQKFNSNGVFITTWGTYGSGNGEFNAPAGVATDPTGNVYVADRDNNRIQKFNSSGNFITKWGSFGSGDGQLDEPRGVATDSAGNVYVADWANGRIQKFTSSGDFITEWGSTGTSIGQFAGPAGVATDSDGNVYVADKWNHRIQKFDSNGSFITKWGSNGSGDDQFQSPAGVATDLDGNVYVADEGNHRIQKFSEEADRDGDGCTDGQELGLDENLGGRRDPTNPWDYYDVNGDGYITIPDDILVVAAAFGPTTDPTVDRTSPPTAAEETDPNKRELWDLGPPDEYVNIPDDILGVAKQFGHTCQVQAP